MHILILLFSLLLTAPAWAAETFEGKVVGISDGDTVTVLTDDKRQVRVRLYGIDCPEKKQAYGDRAKELTEAVVFGKTVRVEAVGRDRYGRTLGIVYGPGGPALNRELLMNGLAWVYEGYCTRPECVWWRNDEAAARSARRGLWSDVKPLPPWQYRNAR